MMTSEINGPDDHLMFWADLSTAIAYYTITSQLLLFVYNPKVVKIFYAANDPKDSKKRHIFRLLFAVAVLFASFISMCGTGHLMNVFVVLYPGNANVKTGQIVIMMLMAIVSFATAIVGFKLFPAIADTIKGLELNSDGKIQMAESYLIEVVELIKESILVLSQDLVVVKCNDVSKLLFGGPVVGSSICKYIHDADLPLFNDTVLRVIDSYNFGPSTIEMRIRYQVPCLTPKSARHSKAAMTRNRNHNKVYCADEPPPTVDELEDMKAAATSARYAKADDEYIWIECTMCKGKQMRADGGFDYDLKMVCRNIDDRKKRQVYQSLMESTEERGRINESKLRYLSCIAHDLKTPLQSFSFSLDLLNHSELQREQRDFVEHANVAIDLMKLTISQTMDISKALTGAKLTPRRTTVFISSVLQRVKIIINGYNKQVPVTFELGSDVCDEIITDEEWLWQMLLNLLTNACKYTDKGSIHVRVSVSQDRAPVIHDSTKSTYSFSHKIPPLRIANDASYMLLCEVIDTGVGIDPSKIGHIFDAFAQVQEGQVTGTGLGLFGVRTRAEGLLGTCGARHNTESSTGTGTVLWFAIPYTPDLESAASVCVIPPTPRQYALGAFRVLSSPNLDIYSTAEEHSNLVSRNTSANNSMSLSMPITPNSSMANANQTATELLIRTLRLTAMVVEDTISVRKLMEKLLLKMGFASVACYENGSKGLDAMMAAPVDIVFSDVQMPIMTGPEMVTRFRKWESIALANANSGDSPNNSPNCKSSFLSTSSTVCNTFRTSRQLIVAVTANGAECGECGNKGFDEICPKPLSRTEIYRIINQHFQT